MSNADVDAAIEVNLRAPIILAAEFARAHLERAVPGQIVFMGSLSGLAATQNTRLYNATKFGLRGFSLSLRQDLADEGIGVTIVEPGFIRDAGMFADGGTKLPKIVRTKSPGDVARAVIRAIKTNPAELFVAPAEHRFSATVATLAPWLTEAAQRRLIAAGLIRKN